MAERKAECAPQRDTMQIPRTQPTSTSAEPCLSSAQCIPVICFEVVLIYTCLKEINLCLMFFAWAGFFNECRQKYNNCALYILDTPFIQFNWLKLKENIANVNIDSILFYNYKYSDIIQNFSLLFPFFVCIKNVHFVVFFFFFSPSLLGGCVLKHKTFSDLLRIIMHIWTSLRIWVAYPAATCHTELFIERILY